ncbi:MAG: GH3 auxin-responsive promoter family protein [Lachnospiraceae bacterium]|nr:GH3 auxin-responsive promoter family protein [Lachnospiraceae bacterium]
MKNELGDNFIKLCDTFRDINNENLRTILRDNRDTVIGQRYGFSDIDSPESYALKVPISSASDYRSYILDMLNGGENVLTSYPLYCYVVTSGSAGQRKILPLTLEALKRYGTYIDDVAKRAAEGTSGQRLFINMLRIDPDEAIDRKEPVLMSEAYYRYQYESGHFDPDDYVGKKAVNFLSGEDTDYLYAKLWSSFATEKVVTIESIFLYNILLFFSYMKKNGRKIICDMKKRCIPKEIKLSLRVRQELLKMDINDDRLDKILAEFSKGYDRIAERLFPDLKLISGIGSRPSLTEEVMLKKYIGSVPVSHFCYVASECHLGIPVGEYDYVLLPESCYYEFRSVDEYTEQTIGAEKLIEGRDYELMITTFNGLYRYELGDVVTVTGFVGQAPVIRFQYRRDLVLNIAGEKTDELTLDSVIMELKDRFSLIMPEYFARADYKELPGRYEILICSGEISEESRLSEAFDEIMCEKSGDYRDLRNTGDIGDPVVRVFDDEEYHRIKTRFMIAGGHVKPVHIVTT